MKVNFESWSWGQPCLILFWRLYISMTGTSALQQFKPMLVDTGVFALEKGLADRGERDRENGSVNRKRRERGVKKWRWKQRSKSLGAVRMDFTSNEKRLNISFWSHNFHIPDQYPSLGPKPKWCTDLYLTIREFPDSSMLSDSPFNIMAQRCIIWGMVGKNCSWPTFLLTGNQALFCPQSESDSISLI